jgi:hypothetical protein
VRYSGLGGRILLLYGYMIIYTALGRVRVMVMIICYYVQLWAMGYGLWIRTFWNPLAWSMVLSHLGSSTAMRGK